jgi:TRAP-type C4-dicarboxylate transport system permease small subunit
MGQIGLVFMVASITYDVILRYVFVAPTHWALEVNTFLLVFLCIIPAGDVLRVGTQIRITFLYDRLRPAVKARLDILRAAAGVFFCTIMIWKGWDMDWKAFRMPTTVPNNPTNGADDPMVPKAHRYRLKLASATLRWDWTASVVL